MTFAIPANPGCFLIEPDDTRQAIVGWLIHAVGTASPVTLRAVADLAACQVVIPGADDAPGLADAPEAPPAATAPAKASSAPSAAQGGSAAPTVAVAFTGKEYAKGTFWHIEDPNDPDGGWILALDGGHAAPVGKTVTKIKRDDYFLLRKTVPAVTAETIMAARAVTPADDSPEESDYGDDLI